ncbi:heparinase II/III family protein [Geomonas sp. RF6]|uniref:heparinase II/III family protein n=1 Tax=Geomonas sp. RF6 TaxID=2897342 RepID=UPI001E39A05D|nr:heparinase II/III family protein [Geomonas sp. RF6]UFS69116.1 heparinase II/III family protein [Geomonas sp. RF6]
MDKARKAKAPMPFTLFVFTVFCMLSTTKAARGLDASTVGTVYGDAAGLARVEILETQFRNMSIKSQHPRIILTPELITRAQARIQAQHYKWASIKSAAANDTIAAAFCYAVTGNNAYASIVYNNLMAETATSWTGSYTSNNVSGTDRKVAEWAIAFDWAYNGLTQQQREALVEKIAAAANIAGRAAWIRAGNRIQSTGGETFHREEWIFWAWRAWPEIVLANHLADADFCYKSRWRYDSIYGDAARAFAYLNDGTPLEGYQYGADGTSWFMALKSATGINLVDGADLHYDISAADYQLYSTDFGLNRNVLHHGVGLGAGGLATYSDTTGNDFNWKTKEYHSVATQLAATTNPYQQWIAKNILTFDKRGASSWIFTNEYYGEWKNFEDIATLLFYDPALPAIDPRQATYDQLPFAKHFDGGNEVYMRSSWADNAVIASFRSTPAFTKTSHGDFDVNSFALYRRGNLAPESGVYDTYQGQTNYIGYQKNTVAHNTLLLIDPANPDSPKKLGNNNPDPGGTEKTTTRTFGTIHPTFTSITNTFLLNKAANWGDIVAFDTSKAFDYAVGEAPKAYGTRATEFTRAVMFLRKAGDKSYVLVFDRVEASDSKFKKKLLLHTVNEPLLNGNVLSTEATGHIYTTDGDSYSATNVFNNSALYGKVLLPQDRRIRKVGGQGYEFWVDGSVPKNWGIDWTVLAADKERYMGGPIQEIGQWRLELMPAIQQQRDLFLNVMYVGDVDEKLPPVSRFVTSNSSLIGVLLEDSVTQNYVVIFNSAKYNTAATNTLSYSVGGTDPQNSLITHIITEVTPDTHFVVKQKGITIATPTSSHSGTISFTYKGGGSFAIEVASTSSVVPPGPLGGRRIQQ